MSVEMYGVEFPDDEVQFATIDGKAVTVINLKGIGRLAKFAPDKEAAAKFIDRLEPKPKQ